MEPRKSQDADLEKRRMSFWAIGLMVSLALTLAAFEWTTFERGPDELASLDIDLLEEEVIPPSAPPPPPPPPRRRASGSSAAATIMASWISAATRWPRSWTARRPTTR